MTYLNHLVNCSVQDVFSPNGSDQYANDLFKRSSNEVNMAKFCSLTGILLIDILLSVEFCKRGCLSVKNKLNEVCDTKTLSRTLLLIISALMLPLVSVLLLIAFVYKLLCFEIIKRKDKQFVGFLDSFDVFWSLEDDAAKSIINVLGVIESDSPFAIANDIKLKLQNIVPNEDTSKIFYRRNEEYGFYYWRKYSLIDMNQYVDVIEYPYKDKLEVNDLENLMTFVQNESLPYNDEGLFKILITRQRIGFHTGGKGNYGIIFRIHHSVGDGVALIEFLCQTFADKTCLVNKFSMSEHTNKSDSPYEILGMMYKLCKMPLCFVDGILRKPDDNTLHGPALLGKKIFKWTESDENLLKMVKDIKENVDHLNFTDVLLTALSNGLRYYFLETMAPVPEDVAVVLPVRFPKALKVENYPIMNNDFSVTILDLPVTGDQNVKEVRRRCCNLRKSADPLTNHYFLKLITKTLPNTILQPILNSNQATMVFSNMPGPEHLTICGGNALKALVFFVPHKGNTGLGVTALCYGGVLRLAAMADTGIISEPENLALVLEGMVQEIKRLHKLHVSK